MNVVKLLFFLLSVILISGCHKNGSQNQLVCIQIIDRNGINETISSHEKLEKYQNINFLNSQPYKQVVRIFENDNSPQKPSVITTYHPNGQIYQYLEVSNARAFGKYRQWFSNGQKEIEATVIGGPAGISEIEQHQWIFDKQNFVWDEKGNLISSFNYDKGKLEGESFFYHANGTLKKIEPYHDNELDGEMLEYGENKNLLSKTHFLNGKKFGESEGFFENQKPAFIEKYENDLLIVGKYFNDQGEMTSQIINGKGLKEVKDDNNKYLIEYIDGLPEGKIQVFINSILKNEYHVKNGQKHGEEIEYYSDGKTPKLSLNWCEDKIQGTVKSWYKNGNIESQREMHNNKKNGVNSAWYLNGNLMLIEEYENNALIKGAYYKINENIPVSTILNGKGTANLYDENGYFLNSVKYLNGYPEIE